LWHFDYSIDFVTFFVHCSETFPSGCMTLDFALGGGLPKGRIVEVFPLFVFMLLLYFGVFVYIFMSQTCFGSTENLN
jgi:hypothetical protein